MTWIELDNFNLSLKDSLLKFGLIEQVVGQVHSSRIILQETLASMRNYIYLDSRAQSLIHASHDGPLRSVDYQESIWFQSPTWWLNLDKHHQRIIHQQRMLWKSLPESVCEDFTRKFIKELVDNRVVYLYQCTVDNHPYLGIAFAL